MELHRRLFSTDEYRADTEALPACVEPGVWAVQDGCTPPVGHDPARLLGKFPALGAMAVSLRTDTMLACQAGTALAERLQQFGCSVGSLAGLALHEIIINAAIHGNLQVESRPAPHWRDRQAYLSRIEAGLANPLLAGRAVTVALAWDERTLCAAVIDQGAGYDVQQLGQQIPIPANRDINPGCPPHRLKLHAAGRGIAIARAAARVEVLDRGTWTHLLFDRTVAAECPQ